MTGLTLSQRRVFRAVAALRLYLGWPPTLREVMRLTGLSRGGAGYHLEHLRDMGLVAWVPNAARTLHLTAKGKEML